jgi:hypothetical protein
MQLECFFRDGCTAWQRFITFGENLGILASLLGGLLYSRKVMRRIFWNIWGATGKGNALGRMLRRLFVPARATNVMVADLERGSVEKRSLDIVSIEV